MALHTIGRKSAAAAAIGLGGLLAACSTQPGAGLTSTQTSAAPLSVACEPNQRALVRQVAVNGVMQAQVQCESVLAPTGTTGVGATVPALYAQAPIAQPVAYTVPMENTRLVPAAYPAPRTVAAPRAAYQPARERVVVRRPVRSVKKSAIIIGSSAGVGAGLGAAFGGKKGAGIGALVAGGGAALWDQITRHKQ